MNSRSLTILFISILYAFHSHAQLDPLDGPVRFIRDYDTRYNTIDGKPYKIQVTRGLITEKGDQLYMRLKDYEEPGKLILSEFYRKENLMNESDNSRGCRITRWFTFSEPDTVAVWGLVNNDDAGGWYEDSRKPDSNDNYGLYVMHYKKSADQYDVKAPLNKRLNYMLNCFYSGVAFAVKSMADSSGWKDIYSLRFSIGAGYEGYAYLDKRYWNCEVLSWFSPLMSKADVQKELQQWRTDFKAIKEAAFDFGGMSAGIQALSYIIPVNKDLCRFPYYGICQGGASKAAGRIYITIVPHERKGQYYLEWNVRAI